MKSVASSSIGAYFCILYTSTWALRSTRWRILYTPLYSRTAAPTVLALSAQGGRGRAMRMTVTHTIEIAEDDVGFLETYAELLGLREQMRSRCDRLADDLDDRRAIYANMAALESFRLWCKRYGVNPEVPLADLVDGFLFGDYSRVETREFYEREAEDLRAANA